MAEIAAKTLTGVEGMMLTDDRYYGLIRFTTDTEPFTVALPSESLMALGMLAVTLAPVAPPPIPGQKSMVEALDVNWWTVGGAADGSLVLTFELEGGGQLGFRLGQTAVAPFQEALLVATGPNPPMPDIVN